MKGSIERKYRVRFSEGGVATGAFSLPKPEALGLPLTINYRGFDTKKDKQGSI